MFMAKVSATGLPSVKLVFKVSFWWYVKMWTQTRMLVGPQSRCFKRIGGMQSVLKYLRINTWSQHVLIRNLPPHEKDRKIDKLDVWVLYSLSEKNKYHRIRITSLLSKQRNDPFLKKMSFITMSSAKRTEWT